MSSPANGSATTVAFPISPSAVPNTPDQTDSTYIQQLYLKDASSFEHTPAQPTMVTYTVDAVQTHQMTLKLEAIAQHEKAVAKARAQARAKAERAKRQAAAHQLQQLTYQQTPTLSSRGSSLSSAVGGGSVGEAAQIAERYVGVPYVWAGASPSGFDCSGLVMYVYNQVGIPLSHSSYADFNTGSAVSESDLQPGDLVFFDTDGPGASHVGIYEGGGTFISASGNHVQNSSLYGGYWGSHFIGARRP